MVKPPIFVRNVGVDNQLLDHPLNIEILYCGDPPLVIVYFDSSPSTVGQGNMSMINLFYFTLLFIPKQ